MESSSRVPQHGNPKEYDFIQKEKYAYLSVSAAMFCQLLSVIHKYSGRPQHISMLTTCTTMFR